MKSTIAGLVCVVIVLLSAASSFSQTAEVSAKPLTENDIASLRQDLTRSKVDVISASMELTKPEADAFWPVYREYANEQNAINAKRLDIIHEYARAMENLDSAKAHDLTAGMMSIDDELVSLKQKYLPKFEAAVGGKRAAKFYQIENRLTLLINLQLANEIPLIQ
ncbi:MAG: hypothetical protein ROO76_13020 [Terriglobia bacterium]|nr:hypothetical protein [Terriglobia bacterium]